MPYRDIIKDPSKPILEPPCTNLHISLRPATEQSAKAFVWTSHLGWELALFKDKRVRTTFDDGAYSELYPPGPDDPNYRAQVRRIARMYAPYFQERNEVATPQAMIDRFFRHHDICHQWQALASGETRSEVIWLDAHDRSKLTDLDSQLEEIRAQRWQSAAIKGNWIPAHALRNFLMHMDNLLHIDP